MANWNSGVTACSLVKQSWGLECIQVHVHDDRNPALDWSVWLVWFSLVCCASVCPYPKTTLLCTFQLCGYWHFWSPHSFWGKLPKVFILHWQKMEVRGGQNLMTGIHL